MTRNAYPIEKYNKVVKELAAVTNFDYPETKEEIQQWRSNYRDMMLGKSAKLRKRKLQQHEGHGDDLMRGRYDVESNGKTNMAATATDDATVSATGGGNDKNPVQRRNNNALSTNTSSTVPKKQAVSSTPSSTIKKDDTNTTRPWMILGPNDWGFCEKSKLPKPPRSHFDYVTRNLVLNMDHYCPWMFNVGTWYFAIKIQFYLILLTFSFRQILL